MEDLLVRPAIELAGLIRSGDVAPRDLVEAALARLAQLEPVLGAFARVDGTGALARAAAIGPADPRPFAGVPVAVKDSTAQRGVPCPIGSRLFRTWRPDFDSYTVQRLQAAGFVIIGRTAMPELGILPTTESRWAAPTRNPWRRDRTPGGSSGGAAAAVAAGVLPIAHGGDGGGSLRVPAACCGLVGLKPARGRISAGSIRG